MSKKAKGPVIGKFIPVEKRIAFKKAAGKARREWLEHRHARSPRCHYCGNPTELKPASFEMSPECGPGSMHATLDHRVPHALGGRDEASNWCLACYSCNQLKGNMTEREYKQMLREEGIID